MTLLASLTLAAQTLLPSTLSLSASESTLMLPGSVTLTATANQTPVAGGVPYGTVTFSHDGANSLGTAPLKIIPSTQAFPSAATAAPSTFGFQPVGIISLNGLSQLPGILVSADSLNDVVTFFEFTNPRSVPVAYQYALGGTPGNIDALAAGYFLKPKSSGILSALIHQGPTDGGDGEYSIFDGSITGTGSGAELNFPVQTASTCNCSDPDSETIAIDDFDGDGYSDVGKLVGVGSVNGVVGVTLNAGASSPGSFQTLVGTADVPNLVTALLPGNFCPSAIATGNFTGTPGSQLVVLGKTIPVGTNCTGVIATYPSSVLIYALQAGALTLVSTTPVDATATALAAADLNGDSKVDLVVAEPTSSGVKVLLGNGDGTFMAPSALIGTLGTPTSMTLSDLNGDGSPDLAVTLGSNGGLAVLLNDGKGNLQTASQPFALTLTPVGLAACDLNGDGLADLAVLLPGEPSMFEGSIDLLINSASSQAALTITENSSTAKPLPVGAHTLTASFPGDNNFAASPPVAAVNLTVAQTVPVVSWNPSPDAVVGDALAYNTPTANVPGTFSFTPALGSTVPDVSSLTVTATFMPTDAFDYAQVVTTQMIPVNLPPVGVSASGPTNAQAGQPGAVDVTLNPFPDPVEITVTLSFAPAPPNTVGDPMVVFSNKTTTSDPVSVPAKTPAATNSFTFQTGSTAGVITATIHVTDTATNKDVTPADLAPVTVDIPAAAPVVSAIPLVRSGQSLQVVVSGLSSTRDMTQAQFTFTPVTGKSLATTGLTVPLTSAFQTWYSSAPSDADGTTFTYTQPFTISGDASDIESVTVTLTNSAGVSEAVTAQ